MHVQRHLKPGIHKLMHVSSTRASNAIKVLKQICSYSYNIEQPESVQMQDDVYSKNIAYLISFASGIDAGFKRCNTYASVT